MSYISAKNNLVAIKKDIINHPFKTGGILLCIVLSIIGTVVLSQFINSYFLKKTSSSVGLENTYQPPSLELSYYKDSETKSDKDLFETDFIVFVHQPPGNFETGFKILNTIKDAECSQPEFNGSTQMTTGSMSSSTYKYIVKCASYKPVLDTKNLFNLSR